MSQAIAKATVTVGPPAGVSGLYLLGFSLPDWMLIITLVLAIGNLFVLVRDKFWRHYLKRKEGPHVDQEVGE